MSDKNRQRPDGTWTCPKCNDRGDIGGIECNMCRGTATVDQEYILDRGFPHCWMPTKMPESPPRQLDEFGDFITARPPLMLEEIGEKMDDFFWGTVIPKESSDAG